MAQKEFTHFSNGQMCRPQKCLLFFVENETHLRALALFTDDKSELLECNPEANIGFEVPPIPKEIIGNEQKDKERAKEKMIEHFETQIAEDGYQLKPRNSVPQKYHCYNMEPI